MKEKLNKVEIVDVFEKCWKELLKEYGENRLFNVYCSEADIQLHLASKVLKKLHLPVCVYVEFPIPLEIDDFVFQRLSLGRTRRTMKKGKGIVADIVVMGVEDLVPMIIAEIKYGPFTWNFFPILYAIAGKLTEEARENVKIALQKEIKRLDTWEKLGPSEAVLTYYLKNVDKIIRLIKNFKEKENESVYAYLCVIDEIYPNLGQILEKEIEKYNPPTEFKLLFQHFPVRSWMQEQLKKL